MEATAGVAASRGGGSLPMTSSRKEWRAVSDHHTVRNVSDEDLEQSKLGQSDERTIYEVQQGREPADVDFCSIPVDCSLGNDLLQQRLHSVARQREELQHLEIELRAQIIARAEIIEMQNRFESQIKEHSNATAKLQEQLLEREQSIHELENKMEEKERELHAIKLDSEASWAKEDLFREQTKELATFRRERDHSEAERAQHIKQIHDLQEHVQEKERQLIELQEQNRAAQETIIYKDEQLREAQAWVARAQLQSTTNQSLQAELRERTEQFNQHWLGYQRQFAEMERLHLHTIQQLRHELADARERNGTFTDESRVSQKISKDVPQFGENNGSQLDANGGGTMNSSAGPHPNANSDNASSFASSGNASTQTDRVPGIPITPSSLLGLPTYLPPGQLPAIHSFIMHQPGVPHALPSHVPQSHVGHFHSMPAMSSLQQWQNQQAVSEGSQISAPCQQPPSQTDQNLLRSGAKYEYDMSINGKTLQSGFLEVHISQGMKPDSVISSSSAEAQVFESMDRSYLVAHQTDQNLSQVSSQFCDVLRLDSIEQNSSKVQRDLNLTDNGLQDEVVKAEEQSSAASASPSDNTICSIYPGETTIKNDSGATMHEALISNAHTNTLMAGKTSDSSLLDERSLLACIVRTIPAGGKIRISSTLPNRLGKMLAPLHWHEYKKQYGELDDFVASHPELFVIEGDYIQLREGAQEMIAATAAFAKVAAAAAASSPYSSFLPSVAVTPMARPKKFIDSNSVIRNQHLNGVDFCMAGGLSNIKILTKSRDPFELNGVNFERSSVISNQNKGSTPARSNFGGKQQGQLVLH
ncbi:uncharacterized protein LOC123227883 isoform X1 [Mangifera indica]|uniref:uncharacterized protein LOC123227883 isoform X1 n=1 Tax=Mangifera indica TaxID=29780 RepID=UPI001CFA6838|nr:uncharacterized protein LOC123227883 isoform X1 [Mangifera indica]XP_044508941.1 uncharacterized protein LOC123227883 isoform X1 [Mangifera indica]